MNKCYQKRRKQLEDDNQRLEQLTAEQDAVTKQLNYENNAAARLQLERQQDVCRDRVNQLALKCDRLAKELQPFQAEEEALQSLIQILTLVSSERVIKAYRSCLQEGRHRLISDTTEALVRELADIPGEPDAPRPLLQFVDRLSRDSALTRDQHQALRAWASTQGWPISESSEDSSQGEEICLMVKVQPRSLNDPSLGYLVIAALVKDPNPFEPEVELDVKPIAISVAPNLKCFPGYSQDDFPLILDQLITTCGRAHGIPLTELTVQWFFPTELMNLPVEHWQIQIGRSQRQCSGIRCKAVIVRSYDRHFLPAYQSASGDWKKYWRRVSPESRCTKALPDLDPMAKNPTIDWNQAKVVGCKFIEPANQPQQEALWDDLLGQGLPVALWMRRSSLEPLAARRMMQPVTRCPTTELPLSLARHRQRGLSQPLEADRLEAASLCLLWDNPFRPFPTLDYQSA